MTHVKIFEGGAWKTVTPEPIHPVIAEAIVVGYRRDGYKAKLSLA